MRGSLRISCLLSSANPAEKAFEYARPVRRQSPTTMASSQRARRRAPARGAALTGSREWERAFVLLDMTQPLNSLVLSIHPLELQHDRARQRQISGPMDSPLKLAVGLTPQLLAFGISEFEGDSI